MRGATAEMKTGTMEQLRLRLVFELEPEPSPEERETKPYQLLRKAMGGSFEQEATLWDCSILLDSIVKVLLTAMVLSEDDSLSTSEQAGRTALVSVESLHYGSPFEVQLLIGALTVPGIATLIYAAKRIYGLDLEFKTHREHRRIEYLEAKQIAEKLESERSDKSEETTSHEPPLRWKVKSGMISDI